jgi:hypothetical protein
MEELIVEGLTPQDFNLLREILRTHRVSIDSAISFNDIINLYSKITEIVNCLREE